MHRHYSYQVHHASDMFWYYELYIGTPDLQMPHGRLTKFFDISPLSSRDSLEEL